MKSENSRSVSFAKICNSTSSSSGQAHVGLGVSANKKDAATNAARDFAQFLIRQKLLDPSELPKLTVIPIFFLT